MEQITAMKITGLTLANFRNHTEPVHFDLGDLTYITGHNGTGKTTTAHAVCYALFGVSYYGEQKIERLMNNKANNVKVQMDFIDQNGTAHSLVRARFNEKNSLLYDGYTITQGQIEQMFCDKNTFIAMFNPTYLTEVMGNDGRELILRHLKPVSKEKVLESISALSGALDGIDLESQSPEAVLKDTRDAIRKTEQQLDVLQGYIESIMDSRESADHKIDDLYMEQVTVKEKIALLKQRQYCGINIEEFGIQRDILTRKLANAGTANPQVTAIKEKLAEAKSRVYVSKLTDEIAKVNAEHSSLQQQYKELNARSNSVKVGDVCPTCKMVITQDNIIQYVAQLHAEIHRITELGYGVVSRKAELDELEKKSKATFEQFKADDIARLTAELQTLEADGEQVDVAEIQQQLSALDDLEKYGNLTEEEYGKLCDLEATLIGIDAQIEALEESVSEEKLKAALAEKNVFTEQIAKYENISSALQEYIFKRAELATQDLDMPNVKIRLYDIIRGTGEVKNTFKFDYKGREYSTLSLSEKTLAGIELAAMMRNITGKDYPICIDNTESIAAFNNTQMPSQIMMIRVARQQPLMIKFQNNTPSTVSCNQELKKAS